ncbi:hypothetical protein ACWOFR_04575 [Carnobacterium gallinarum]|uniref:membrane protein n=1 Tax=Carnobacterium gallinarum TaxID=2749 RepID=UPI000557DB3D|nr:membrane protein [Carnobacterium gallinarum]
MIRKIDYQLRRHPELFIGLSFLLFSILVIAPVYLNKGQILTGDDYRFHQNRIEGLAQSIQNGIWFPKVNYFFIGGYGYASSLFYSDFYLYIPALLRVAGLPLATAYIVFTVLLNLATFVVTYISGKIMGFSMKNSYLFSLLYTLSIYRLQDLISRQAIGEVLAMTFFPLVLASLYELKNKSEPRWWLLTIGMTGIGLAHIISVEMMAVFILLFSILNAKTFFTKKVILAVIKAGTLTVLLLLFFLLPILEQFLHTKFQVTTNPLVRISTRGLDIIDLIRNSSVNAIFHAKSGNIGVILLVALISYAIILVIKKGKIKNRDSILLAVFFFILTTTIFPWGFFDQTVINTIQFPWRFLSFITLLVTYLIADDQFAIFQKKPVSYYLLIALTLLSALAYGTRGFVTEKQRVISYQNYNQPNSYFIGAGREYLPDETNYRELRKAKERPLIYDAERVQINNQQSEFSSYSFDYQVKDTETTTVIIPFIYYYGYQAKVANTNELLKVNRDPNTGLVSVDLKGKGQVTVSYQETTLQKLSIGISFLTFISCVWVVVKRRINKG